MLPSDYQVSVDTPKNITKAKANHFDLIIFSTNYESFLKSSKVYYVA